MLGWIASLPGRAKAFADRNKYRILTLGAVAGGVWYYYGDTLKQAWQVYQLMQSLQADSEDNSSPPEEPDQAYVQTVLTGDETSQKQFQTIRTHRTQLYADEIEWLQQELRKPPEEGTSKREQLFDRLCLVCFCRLVTSLIVVYALMTVARVEVCLIGRANRRQIDDEDAKADHRELLSGLRSITAAESVEKVDAVSRSVVKEVFARNEISATSAVKQNKLEETLGSVVERALTELAKDNFAWLLGRLAISDDQSTICKQTLDVLEAPQYRLMLTHLVKRGLNLSLERSIPEGTMSAFPLAVLIAGIRAEAETVTTPNGPHVGFLKESPVVDEFCRAVYHATDEPDPEDLALLQHMSNENDPGMAQLGDLLEKLVKADMTKK